ncbi:MAG: class I SAM-dependent methyltransferase [Candidatus Omnitrophica bacterium]|nr:class I SAM-dependent methyltransferase [Candidatus Omnitrophota bacterium]
MTACVVCESTRVEAFLDFGTTALANKFLTKEELSRAEPAFPLRVGFCHGCTHVQLMERVAPRDMFTDYLYVSSASETLTAHLFELSDVVARRFRLGAGDLVVDIGCNDGTLLRGFQRHGVKTLGVDPAKNLAALAAESGMERFVGFFNSQTATQIAQRWGRASAITATNTFPHVPELRDFMEGIRTALAPGGVFVIEAHYLLDLLEQAAFDTIYHEHVSYWALAPMMGLFERCGMQVVDVERLPIHHGQLRVFVQRTGEGRVQPSVARQLDVERSAGLDRLATFRAFADRTQQIKRQLKERLRQLRAESKRVAGYGAPAKGSTLLGFLELGPQEIDYIVDRSPLKQGRFTPGSHIPIVPAERLLEDQPDVVVVLAWNFLDEIMDQQQEYLRRGGTFLLPVPEVRLITAESSRFRHSAATPMVTASRGEGA